MQLDELIEGQAVRAEVQMSGNEELVIEGTLVDLDEDVATIFVEAENEFVDVEADAITGARPTAFARLIEADPDLAADLLEEELVALLGPETDEELFEAAMALSQARLREFGRRRPKRARLVQSRAKSRRPRHELSAFLSDSKRSWRRRKRPAPSGSLPR